MIHRDSEPGKTTRSDSEIVLVQNFDQSIHQMLCERAHRTQIMEKYFGQANEDEDAETIQANNIKLDQLGHLTPTYSCHLNQQRAKQLPTTMLNQLTFDLAQYGQLMVGTCFEIQIELLDSYKRLHKSAPISQVLITPEFFGHEVPLELDESKLVETNEYVVDGEKILNLVVPIGEQDQNTKNKDYKQ